MKSAFKGEIGPSHKTCGTSYQGQVKPWFSPTPHHSVYSTVYTYLFLLGVGHGRSFSSLAASLVSSPATNTALRGSWERDKKIACVFRKVIYLVVVIFLQSFGQKWTRQKQMFMSRPQFPLPPPDKVRSLAG